MASGPFYNIQQRFCDSFRTVFKKYLFNRVTMSFLGVSLAQWVLMKFDQCSHQIRCMRPMPFNCIFYCGSFDIYHSGLARSHLFFVPVYIVKISTVWYVVYILKGWIWECFIDERNQKCTVLFLSASTTYRLSECISQELRISHISP